MNDVVEAKLHPYRELCSEIHPGLWVGATPAMLGKKAEVDPMFNVVVQLYLDETYRGWSHQIIVSAHMHDTASSPSVPFPDEKVLKRLARFVSFSVSRMKPVLVHCHQGFNRSGLIAALALCLMGRKPNVAVMQVMQRRPGALFNQEFVDWILANGQKL